MGNNPTNFTDPSGLAPTGPSNSNGTSYPGDSSSGCLSQLTPGAEQTATDAVAEVEGIDFSHGSVVVAGALQCLGNVAPGMLGAGLPGYPGLQQQNQDPGGYEAALGLTPSAPPSIGHQIVNEIGGFVNGAVDGAVNVWNLILNAAGGENKPSLLDPKGEQHVLGGDATGGGHRNGTGKPGKSEFPADWPDDRITGEISDVATDPAASRSRGRNGREIVRGTRGGVDIEVVIEPNGRIVTGYPTNLPRNPR